MPLKWKIFFALNFVLSLPALVCFILLFINLIESYNHGSDYLFAFLFLFGLLVITLNGFLNIYTLQRFFPDKLMPAGITTLNTTSLVFNILSSIGVLILCIYAASFVFGDYQSKREGGSKVALSIIFFLWLVQVAVLIMQGLLPGVISRNHRRSMNSLIDSIGQ